MPSGWQKFPDVWDSLEAWALSEGENTRLTWLSAMWWTARVCTAPITRTHWPALTSNTLTVLSEPAASAMSVHNQHRMTSYLLTYLLHYVLEKKTLILPTLVLWECGTLGSLVWLMTQLPYEYCKGIRHTGILSLALVRPYISLSLLFHQLILTMRFRQAFSIYFDLWPKPLLLLNLRYIVPNLLLHYQSTFSFAVLCFCFLGCSSGEHTANRQNKASSSTELPQSACLAYISGVWQSR